MQQGGGPGERPRGNGLTPGRAMLITAAVLVVLLGAYIIVQIKSILILFLIGVLLATAIEPVVDRLHARGLGRGQSVLVVYAAILVVVGVLLGFLVPAVVNEIGKFINAAPNLIDELNESVKSNHSPFIRENGPYVLDEIERRIAQLDIPTERALSLATYLPSVLSYFIGGIITVVTTLLIGFYWITEKAIIKRVFLSLFPDERRAHVHTLWDDIETKLGGWIRGQLILMGIIGIAASIGYAAMGLKFWMLLGVLAGLCEIIPFFGPWISGVPAVLIALTQSPRLALIVIAFMVAIQMIEGNLLVPRVMKNSVGLSPLLVVLAVLIGGTLLGIAGGVIAIPVAAVIQVLLGDLLRSHQEALAREGRADGTEERVFRWRPAGLPSRLQRVQPGPAVVSPVVELPRPPAPAPPPTANGADLALEDDTPDEGAESADREPGEVAKTP
ncbi:MAG TPA: AI-2E family transporter [Thermomicrobiales bacterium]|nr:AI-2E family transporter [Thermomicrobiales bacterium]